MEKLTLKSLLPIGILTLQVADMCSLEFKVRIAYYA